MKNSADPRFAPRPAEALDLEAARRSADAHGNHAIDRQLARAQRQRLFNRRVNLHLRMAVGAVEEDIARLGILLVHVERNHIYRRHVPRTVPTEAFVKAVDDLLRMHNLAIDRSQCRELWPASGRCVGSHTLLLPQRFERGEV